MMDESAIQLYDHVDIVFLMGKKDIHDRGPLRKDLGKAVDDHSHYYCTGQSDIYFRCLFTASFNSVRSEDLTT